MTHFNRKYSTFSVGASVSAEPDIEVSINGDTFIASPEFVLTSVSMPNPSQVTDHRGVRFKGRDGQTFYLYAVVSASTNTI